MKQKHIHYSTHALDFLPDDLYSDFIDSAYHRMMRVIHHPSDFCVSCMINPSVCFLCRLYDTKL